MKFDDRFKEKFSYEQMVHPNKRITFYRINPKGYLTIVNALAYTSCDCCRKLTKWRDIGKKCCIPVCSDECWLKIMEEFDGNNA